MRIKNTFAALTMATALVAGCTTAQAAEYNELSIYARAAVVVAVDIDNETVTAQDAAGNLWSFYSDGAGDWLPGDGVSLAMYDNGTEDISDDEVISARYERFDLLPNV